MVSHLKGTLEVISSNFIPVTIFRPSLFLMYTSVCKVSLANAIHNNKYSNTSSDWWTLLQYLIVLLEYIDLQLPTHDITEYQVIHTYIHTCAHTVHSLGSNLAEFQPHSLRNPMATSTLSSVGFSSNNVNISNAISS